MPRKKQQELVAEKLAAKWVEILGLTDWSIMLYTSGHDSATNSEGQSMWWRNLNKAEIYVNNIGNKDEESIEEDIIHELLHIKLWSPTPQVEDGCIEDQVFESTVESLAQVMASLERKARPKNRPRRKTS